jgi:DNA-binding HxlR family transcriptional regulator
MDRDDDGETSTETGGAASGGSGEATDGGSAAASEGEGGPDGGLGVDVEAGRAAACERRAAAPAAEVERVERTMADLLSLLGKAHTMALLREFALEEGPWRFTELEERLGVSPNTLSERLKELTRTGLLSRRAYDEIPPRVEYTATERAHDLFPVFGHLARWAEVHDLGPEGASDGADANSGG